MEQVTQNVPANKIQLQVNIDFMILLHFNFSNISLLTLYAEMFKKLMIQLFEAMNYDDSCESCNC